MCTVRCIRYAPACTIINPPDPTTQMCQNQAIRYLKAIDDTVPTTVNIGTATQLWGCEILCNLQQYMNEYRQQYKSAQGGDGILCNR